MTNIMYDTVLYNNYLYNNNALYIIKINKVNYGHQHFT